MRKATINMLCCPFDKADLDLKIIGEDLEGNVLEGIFTCTSCKRVYHLRGACTCVLGSPVLRRVRGFYYILLAIACAEAFISLQPTSMTIFNRVSF